MNEHEIEPVPGLPGKLPAGERMLWQGAPDRRTLARTAFHTNLVLGYFAVLSVIAAASGSRFGTIATAICGVACFALLHLIAWGGARTTLYTLTDRRIVLRIGIAMPTCINLPLALVSSAGLRLHTGGTGDLPIALTDAPRLGYAVLWPHARPWKFGAPQPMLRGIPDAARVATLLAKACADRAGMRPVASVVTDAAMARAVAA